MTYMDMLTGRVLPGRRGEERMRTIVFVVPPGSVSPALKQAAEEAFPWTVIEEVSQVDQAIRIFPSTVSLLILHPDLIADAERSSADLFRYHPLALTAVLHDDMMDERELALRLATSQIIRSILPIQVRHDISLSILGLLLQGIEYCPRRLLGAAMEHVSDTPPAAREPEEAQPIAMPLRVLTKREMQVLEMVQRGLQNKSIANDLNLSRHTVKIHLHNIISKLGARNRTEAAAFYRDAVPAGASLRAAG
ncbi:DNA-binding response regulator, NarL/FixJ family, contains REC and HTH domains [Devosia crocina]|uniref:DNA-binding response regulator, NarL/FixJ family, contains REC and HTH domains n=2 Tax=Devosia crocina TaxID=429728 RepID=A0A1I7MZK5_9HYPH|nr:DNA-binding response regulator, NarL/FixJ family, contains REC and HTH domains [Devosia crocina]